jgi:hypothetical protein
MEEAANADHVVIINKVKSLSRNTASLKEQFSLIG